jgi:hypothetical protein
MADLEGRTVELNGLQAFDVLRQYLDEYLNGFSSAEFADVLGDMNPRIWADRAYLDPAVPGDWANAVTSYLSVAGGRQLEADTQGHILAADAWLAIAYRFLGSLRPALGNVPLGVVIGVLSLPQTPVAGSSESPLELWTAAILAANGLMGD